jgi:hypothetical protein
LELSVVSLLVGGFEVAGFAEHFKVVEVMPAAPDAVASFAGDDVVHFDLLEEVVAAGASEPCGRFFGGCFGLGPTVVGDVGTVAGA